MRITCVHALATICIIVKYSRIICPLVDSLVGIKCSFQHRYSDIQHKLISYGCSMLSLDSVDNVASIVFAVFDSTARLTKGSISCIYKVKPAHFGLTTILIQRCCVLVCHKCPTHQ